MMIMMRLSEATPTTIIDRHANKSEQFSETVDRIGGTLVTDKIKSWLLWSLIFRIPDSVRKVACSEFRTLSLRWIF
jgi:hypothetical protein